MFHLMKDILASMFVVFGYYNNGMFMLKLNKVPDDSGSVYMSSSIVVNSSLCHARLGHLHYKRMLEMSKDELIRAINENLEKCTTLPFRKPATLETDTPKLVVTLVYSRKPRKSKTNAPVSNPKLIKSISSNKKEPSKSLGSIVSDVSSSSLDECGCPNCSLIGNVTISRVYYVEGLGHNLFFVGQLSRHGLVRGLPKLKFEKNHLCSTCTIGKSKKKPHKPKSEDTNQIYLLPVDLCGLMRVASINGKKYILFIVDDYSRFTWTPVRRIKTDNGTEFVNHTLREYYEKVGISYETYVARSPQQNGVVERRNRSLIEAARTMLIYAKAPLFIWAEPVATAC
nr:hypothetical protein [Tanacetum cinerariifolium]